MRQLPAAGTSARFETFILATITGSPTDPVSQEYRTEQKSRGSAVVVLTSRASATSSRKSVTCAPASPPTDAANGAGPVWAAGTGPGSDTVVLPSPVIFGPEI